jgi:hypothetical protein
LLSDCCKNLDVSPEARRGQIYLYLNPALPNAQRRPALGDNLAGIVEQLGLDFG